MNVMKELAGADGNGMSQSQRINQLEELMKTLTSSGGNASSIQRSALQWQEGFGNDSIALRESGSKIIGQTMGSNNLMAIAGQKLGVTGMMPGAMEAELTDMGYSETEITELAATEAAKYVAGLPKRNNRIAAFRSLMADNGIQLDWPEAKDLYDKVTSGKSGSERANAIIQKQASKGGGSGPGSMSRYGGGGSGPGEPGYVPSENAERVEDNFSSAQQQKDPYAPAGQRPRQLPQSVEQVQQQRTFSSSGIVSGEVRIVGDPQGRVSAPQVIQLSGTQKAVNAGAGSAQLNNAPPGETHAYNPFGGGV